MLKVTLLVCALLVLAAGVRRRRTGAGDHRAADLHPRQRAGGLCPGEPHGAAGADPGHVPRGGHQPDPRRRPGLFHLYEHMLFKGNRVYPNQTALQAAMKDLGVANWNGGTSQESVSYFFTVPVRPSGQGDRVLGGRGAFPAPGPGRAADGEGRRGERDPRRLQRPGQRSTAPRSRSRCSGNTRGGRTSRGRRLSSGRRRCRCSRTCVTRGTCRTTPRSSSAATWTRTRCAPPRRNTSVTGRRRRIPWASPPPPHPPLTKDLFLVSADEEMYAGLVSVDLRFQGPDVLQHRVCHLRRGRVVEAPRGSQRQVQERDLRTGCPASTTRTTSAWAT